MKVWIWSDFVSETFWLLSFWLEDHSRCVKSDTNIWLPLSNYKHSNAIETAGAKSVDEATDDCRFSRWYEKTDMSRYNLNPYSHCVAIFPCIRVETWGVDRQRCETWNVIQLLLEFCIIYKKRASGISQCWLVAINMLILDSRGQRVVIKFF